MGKRQINRWKGKYIKMNRIEARLEQLKKEGKKAFITYMTAGLPDYNKTKEIIKASEEGGVDVIELGIPFSDPVADGPVIQDASYKAILNGATLEKTFEMMQEIRDENINVPILYMMYYNHVYHYGVEAFVKRCIECGVDGLIIPDLPFEEQKELKDELCKYKESPILIQLVAPVSNNRIPKILKGARGFVYCVSQMGVTGNGATFHKMIKEYLTQVKSVSEIPVMMGFGIRTAQDVKPVKDIIDGAIVGSHFIKLLEESDYDVNVAKNYISEFKKELNL